MSEAIGVAVAMIAITFVFGFTLYKSNTGFDGFDQDVLTAEFRAKRSMILKTRKEAIEKELIKLSKGIDTLKLRKADSIKIESKGDLEYEELLQRYRNGDVNEFIYN